MTLQCRKKVYVTFAGDDDVIQHIVPLKERKQSAFSQKTKLKKKKYEDDSESAEEEKEDDEEEAGVTLRPSTVLTEAVEIGGRQVYQFKTPTKARQMVQKAYEASVIARTPTRKTPSKSNGAVTPTSKGTPSGRRSVRIKKKISQMTPHRLRARNKESSSEESEASSVSGEDEEEEEETVRTPRGKRGTPRAGQDNNVRPESVQEYFHSQAAPGLGVTSDHTLARLETPRMDQEALSVALTGVALGYKEEREQLLEEHWDAFPRWMYNLCNGFNVMLYGVGSKRELVEAFRTTVLKDFTHIVINGYFPSLTLKNILTHITEDILEHIGSFRSVIEQCEFIQRHYECSDYEDFYIIVHNLDGPMLRSHKVQSVLGMLANTRGIHVVASIDHINAPLMWDQMTASRFNWAWYDATTYAPYSEETSYENSLLVQQTGSLALSSLTHVMRSLTANARGIFLLLARHQLKHADNSLYQGLALPELYQKCREAFLVNSDLTLRTQLTEFKDHKLIKTKKGPDGMEYLTIPLDGATLTEFLEQQEDEIN
ncbi:Origin recognition complex subunit 2 [Lamellibrachia satsuma]|nr:Origin recognition complex subunit 2 [Lamellibrachia satsuma]